MSTFMITTLTIVLLMRILIYLLLWHSSHTNILPSVCFKRFKRAPFNRPNEIVYARFDIERLDNYKNDIEEQEVEIESTNL